MSTARVILMHMTTGEVTVEILSLNDVENRRRELLNEVGLTVLELRDRAHAYDLSIDDLQILRELERLDFLAGR